MSTDSLAPWGLKAVELGDRATLTPFFHSLVQPLSDYTFSQLYTWRNSLRIAWRILENHLCVFANGSGDLTLLVPPIGDTGSDRALSRAIEIMDDYNRAHHCPDRTRVEYVSEELLGRFNTLGMAVTVQGADYLYDVKRMVDLAGGDLSSKRQAKNRFIRNYRHDVERYDGSRHFDGCRELLNQWKDRQDSAHAGDATSAAIKRTKELLATQLALEYADELGLRGLVVRVAGDDGAMRVRGFTFGEHLGADQSSIVIEKTDLECKGLAQFIFSEFCATCWADRPLVNAGDDWGLESLAWTKSSYRPVGLLRKYVLAPPPVEAVGFAGSREGVEGTIMLPDVPEPDPDHLLPKPSPIAINPAARGDLAEVAKLETACFTKYTLSRRQLLHLQRTRTAVFLVARSGERIVGEGIALIRRNRGSVTGRIYSLAVDRTLRRAGVGRKLMKEIFEGLSRQGVRRVFLEVEASNTAAIALYQRLGFEPIGELSDYYGPGLHGVHMKCEMAAATVAA